MFIFKIMKSNLNIFKSLSIVTNQNALARATFKMFKFVPKRMSSLFLSSATSLSSVFILSQMLASTNMVFAKEKEEKEEEVEAEINEEKDMDAKIHLDLNEIYEKSAVAFLSNKDVIVQIGAIIRIRLFTSKTNIKKKGSRISRSPN